MRHLFRDMAPAVLLVAGWVASPAQAAPGAAPTQSLSGTRLALPADARVDLSDPKVRERLRAAGVDPDELQKLLTAKEQAVGATAPGQAPPGAPLDNLQPGQFPPVTPPPGASSAAPVDTSLVRNAEAESVKTTEKNFGYDVFTLKPTTFEPLAFGPVSPDYLVGPGDEVIVSVWGGVETNARVTVNREGFILLPDIGQVSINGLTVRGLKESLEKRLARIYSGIQHDGRGRTFVDVSLGKLRSMQVFVLGDVVQPGGYTLSATSTVMNALYFAGGPTLKGSMRNVRVLRDNQVRHRVDLYQYIASGERSQDVKLESGDVVFVPPIGKRVRLEGEVHHPASFEVRDEENLADLLRLAGGLKSTAYLPRAQITRQIPFAERAPLAQEDRKVLDCDLRAGGATPGAGIVLVDGDFVQVFRVNDILKNTVRLAGTAVYKPGTYEHHSGMTIADLIDAAGGLLGDVYTGWAHLVRTRPDKTRELLSFNLAAAMRHDPKANLELLERDEVQVFSVWDIRDKEFVTISGLVRKPGKYELLQGMTVTDLIVKASGLCESAYRVRAEVSRIDPNAVSEGKMADLVYVGMADSLKFESESAHFKLRKNDIVFVREIPNWGLQENVWMTGEVKFPGMYSLTSKLERLSSIVERAGSVEPTAYLQAATFIRKKDGTGRMAIDFQQALRRHSKNPNKYDLVLAAGDSIHIPREPKAVKVTGDVGFPSSVLWEEGRNMDYYVEQAGGLLDTADKGKISVVMASGRVERPGFLRSPQPDAGATIVVPRKPEQKERETLKNFAQIISILSGAATTIYLISRTAN